MKSNAQSAVEYLMIIALTFGLIVPTAYLFFRYSSDSNLQIVDSQIINIGRSIIDTAQSVYYSGENSKIILDIKMPDNVGDVYIMANRELVFELVSEISATGNSQVVFFSSSSIPITSNDPTDPNCIVDGNCDLSEITESGLLKLSIEAVLDSGGDLEILIQKV